MKFERMLRRVFCRIFCCDEFPDPDAKKPVIRWRLRIGSSPVVLFFNGDFSMSNVNSDVVLALKPVWTYTDKDGNPQPTKVDANSPVTLVCDRTDLYTVSDDPAVPGGFLATPLPRDQLPESDAAGVVGTATFTAQADADRSEAVRDVFAVGSVVMILPEATTGSLEITQK